MNNYEITILVQAENDIEAMLKTAALAKAAGEIAYLKHGLTELGFFTHQGDYGKAKHRDVQEVARNTVTAKAK